MASANTNRADFRPPAARPVLLVGEPGAGAQYLDALFSSSPRLAFLRQSFCGTEAERLAEIAALVGADNVTADAAIGPLRSWARLSEELCGRFRALIVPVTLTQIEQQQWFDGVDEIAPFQRGLAIAVRRNPVWSMVDAARRQTRYGRVFLDVQAVGAAVCRYEAYKRRLHKLFREQLVCDVHGCWGAARFGGAARRQLGRLLGVEFGDAPVAAGPPPLIGRLDRLVANLPELLKALPRDAQAYLRDPNAI